MHSFFTNSSSLTILLSLAIIVTILKLALNQCKALSQSETILKFNFLLTPQLFYTFKIDKSTLNPLQTSAANINCESLLTFTIKFLVTVTWVLTMKNQYAEINLEYSGKKDLSATAKYLSVKKAHSKYSDPISHIVLPIIFIS